MTFDRAALIAGSDARWGYEAGAMSGLGMGRGTSVSASTALRAYWEGQSAVLTASNFSHASTASRLLSGSATGLQLAPRGNPAYELAP